MSDLPPRLTTSEVLTLARISAATFRRRRRSGAYVLEPCDRGAEDLYSLRDVCRVFPEIAPSNQETPIAPPRQVVDAEAIRAARAGQIRQRPGPQERDSPRPVRGSGKAPAVRLAFDASATD